MNEITQPLTVSIIIPVYNGSNYLKEAIDSALAQTYQHIEIIIINDGSNDNGATENIATSFGNKVKYYYKTNGGVASALNFGISKMTGDYFSWLSHDDLYEQEKVKTQVDYLLKLKNKKVILYSDYSVFTRNPDRFANITLIGVSPKNFRYWICRENSLHGCTLLIPKVAFKKHGDFKEDLRTTQDYDMWFRLASDYQFVHMPVSLVKARSHVDQDSYRLQKIAQIECNNLLSNFIKQLTLSEIKHAAPYCTPGLAYAQLASSMWYRGFFRAGNVTAFLSIKNIINSPTKEILLASLIFMKGYVTYFFVKPMRKIMSPFFRLKLKNLIHFIAFRLFSPKVNKASIDKYDALERMTLKDKFTTIYEDNLFQGRTSRSGEGSDLKQTTIIRQEIPKIIDEFNISSFLDAPCGDWYWMRHTQLNVKYIGVDIVEELIHKNQMEHANELTTFQQKNLVSDPLPQAELIFSRDCLVHLSFQDAVKIIKNFKASGAKYLLTTTFTNRNKNDDLGEGFWRTLNMQLAPFNFPNPLKLINEGCTEGENLYDDKCLGLWKLEDIDI